MAEISHIRHAHIVVMASLSSLFSSMRGRQQLSCPVLRSPSGPNARPQDNTPYIKGIMKTP